jgi:membrane protease YdiL (CAAX protease family)
VDTSKQKIKPVVLVAILVMAFLTFTSFFGLSIAGIAVLVGVAFFFVDKGRKSNSGLEIKSIGKDLANPRIWFWITMPAIMNIICTGLAKLVVPDFIDHVLARTSQFLSFSPLPLLAVQLVVAALGEEIAWRAFFQKQLNKVCPASAALLITSIFFSLGHLANGTTAIVIYDLLFITINSVFYGIVFLKTNNAWVSTISHIIANIVSLSLMFL